MNIYISTISSSTNWYYIIRLPIGHFCPWSTISGSQSQVTEGLKRWKNISIKILFFLFKSSEKLKSSTVGHNKNLISSVQIIFFMVFTWLTVSFDILHIFRWMSHIQVSYKVGVTGCVVICATVEPVDYASFLRVYVTIHNKFVIWTYITIRYREPGCVTELRNQA